MTMGDSVPDFVFGQMRISADNTLEISTSMNASRLLGMIDQDDIAATRDALWVLWKLSQDDRMKVNIRELDGLGIVLKALTLDSQEVRRYALRTLCNLSFDDNNNAEIRQLGGVKPIVDCLDFDPEFGEDVETTRAALRTLCNLSANDDNKAEIRELGGLGAIIDCLDSSDMRTQRDALRVICNLSIDATNRQELQPYNTIAKIVDSFAVNDAEMKRYALASIINMTNDEENAPTIRDLGGVAAVLSCLDVQDLDIRRFALRSLCNLAVNDQNKVILAQSTQLKGVIDCVQDSDAEVRCYALATLMHVFANDDNNSRAEELCAVAPVVQSLMSQEDDVKRYATGLLCTMCKINSNSRLVRSAGALDIVLDNLRDRNPKTRRVSAKLLRSLLPPSCDMTEIGIYTEQLVPIVDYLTIADPETCRCASDVLLNLSESVSNHDLLSTLSMPSPWCDLLSSDPSRRQNARQSLQSASVAAEDAAEKRRTEREGAAKQRRSLTGGNTRVPMAMQAPGPRSRKKASMRHASAVTSAPMAPQDRTKILDLENEVQLLRSELQRHQPMQPSSVDSSGASDDSSKRLSELEHENESLRAQVQRYQAMPSAKHAEDASSETPQDYKAQSLEAENEKLKQEQERAEVAERKLSEVTKRLKTAEDRNVQFATTISSLESDLERRRDGDPHPKDKEVASLNTKLLALREEFQQHQAASAAREDELEKRLAMRLAVDGGELGDPIEQLSAAYEKVRELQKEMTMMEQFHSREVSALRAELEATQATVQNTYGPSKDAQARNNELSLLKQTNEAANSKVAALEKIVQDMQEQSSGIASDNSSVGELLASAQSRVHQLMEELSSQTHHAEQEARKLEDKIAQLENELEAVVRSKNTLKDGTDLVAENSRLRHQLDSMIEASEQKTAKIAGQEEHIASLSRRNDELRAMLERKGDEVLPVRAMETRILILEAELEKQNTFIDAERVKHEAEIAGYQQRAASDGTRAGDMERVRNEMSNEAQRQRETLQRERATAEAAAEKIAALRSELAQQSEFYQKELDAHEREKENLYAEVMKAETKISEMNALWEHTTRDKEYLQHSHHALSKEKHVETSAGEERVKLLEAELLRQESFAREQIQLLTDEARSLEAELKKTQNVAAMLRQAGSGSAQAASHDANAPLAALQSELKQVKQEHVAALEQVDMLKEELANQSGHADRSYEEQMQQIEMLQEKLRSSSSKEGGNATEVELRSRIQMLEQERASKLDLSSAKQQELIRSLTEEISSSESKIRELEHELNAQMHFGEQEKAASKGGTETLLSQLQDVQRKYTQLQQEYDRREKVWQTTETAKEVVQQQAREECAMALEKVSELQNEMELQQAFHQGQQVDIQHAIAIASEKAESMAIRRTQQTERRTKDDEIRMLHQQFNEDTEQLRRELSSLRAEVDRLRQRLPEYRNKRKELQQTEASEETSESVLERSQVDTKAHVSDAMDIAEQLQEIQYISDDAEIRSRQVLKASQFLQFIQGNEHACYEVQTQNGIHIVCGLLNNSDSDVVSVGCKLLARLCSMDELARAVSEFDEVLPALVNVLQNARSQGHQMGQMGSALTTDAEGRRAALAALASLSAITDNERKLLGLDTLKALIQMFTSSDAGNTDVQRNITGAILNLVYSPSSKDQVRQYGGLKHVIKALDLSDVVVQRTAMRILTHLSVTPENRVEIRMLSGIPLVIRGLSTSDVEIQRSATMLLINLSVNAKNKTTIYQAGGIQPLLHLVTGSAEADIRSFSVRTLCNLATDEDNREEVRRLHGIGALVSCVQNSRENQLAKYASRCIGLLAASDLCLDELIRLSCQSILADCISTSSDDVAKEAVLALTRMCRSEVVKSQAKTFGVVKEMLSEVEARSQRVDNGQIPKESEDMLAIALKFLAAVSDNADVRTALINERAVKLMVSYFDCGYLQHLKPAIVCIANLSVVDSVKAELRNLECVSKVVKGIQHSDPNVCSEMLRILYNLASLAENRTSIGKLGGVLYVVDALSSKSLSVQHAAVKALQQLTVDAENEAVIAKASCIRPLVGLLRSEHIDTLRRVLCCLGNLTLSTENQLLVASVQGIPNLISCLQSTDVRIRRDAARTVRNVAFANSNKQVLLEAGAVPQLLRCLDSTAPDDAETGRYAMRALGVLSMNDTIASVIVACKGMQLVLATLQVNDLDTRRSAAGALINLCNEDHHRDELRKLGGVKIVLRCLITSQDAETGQNILRCLFNLCKSSQAAAEVCQLGGIQPVVKYMQSHDKEMRRNSCAVLSLLSGLALGIEQMRTINAMPVVVACMKENDIRIRRDAAFVLAALCENESDHTHIIEAGGLKAIAAALATKDTDTQKYCLRCIKLLAFNSQVHRAVKDGSLGIMQEIHHALESSDPEVVIIAKDAIASISMTS